jgi:hypothetical protein
LAGRPVGIKEVIAAFEHMIASLAQ